VGRAEHIRPEEYVLAALSPEERLDAALRIAREAFRGTKLTAADLDAAVRRVRRRLRSGRANKTPRGR
jgi:hypothetical protein